jgi:hypothetical protein
MIGWPLTGTSEAAQATRQAIIPKVKAEASALENGCEMTEGKNVWPRRICCWWGEAVLMPGPRSVLTGL